MGKVKTLKDIEREELELWKRSCKKEVFAQILLNQLKKRKLIKKTQAKEIQDRINKLGKDNFNKVKGGLNSSQP